MTTLNDLIACMRDDSSYVQYSSDEELLKVVGPLSVDPADAALARAVGAEIEVRAAGDMSDLTIDDLQRAKAQDN